MQRLVLQMGSQAARVGAPLVAPVALEGHHFGGREVFGGPLELENTKHNKLSREVGEIVRSKEQVLRTFWVARCTKHYNPART